MPIDQADLSGSVSALGRGEYEQIRANGAFGPVSAVQPTLGEYADAGVETRTIVRFTAADQREQFERFTRAVDL